jgi:hypothetical protein
MGNRVVKVLANVAKVELESAIFVGVKIRCAQWWKAEVKRFVVAGRKELARETRRCITAHSLICGQGCAQP